MGFLDDLLGALGLVTECAVAILVYIFQLIVAVAVYIYNVLVLVANFLFTIIKDVGQFFHFLWDSFFKGILTALLNGIVKLGRFLHAIFGPVVDFLRRVSQFIDRIYRVYVRPILRILQITRTFLTLLRALGVKWAAKLDSILASVQHDIQAAFLYVRGILNVVIDLLNILADPTNLLRRPTTILSLRRVMHAFVRQITGLPPGFFYPSPSRFAPPGMGNLPLHFDPADPTQNPPPSYYLAFGDGVPDFGFLGPGEVPDDTSIDGITMLDYFNDTQYDALDCVDPVQCLIDASLKAIKGQ